MAIINIYGTLDEAIPSVKHQLYVLPPNSAVIIKINATGGTIGAFFKLWGLFQAAKREKNLTYKVVAINIRSAALMLFICFPIEERIITKKSKGVIHLPMGTYDDSDVRERAIMFIAEKTLLAPVQVIYQEYAVLDAYKMVKLGIANKVHELIPTE